jgi:gluconate 2-dehydrogenase gamma chain
MDTISRRSFLKAAGAAAAGLATACDRASRPVTASRTQYAWLNVDEAGFIEPAIARLVPADESGPGALEANVAVYIDLQLAGAWGAGERLYRSGPWQQGKPTQGYQLPFTPAELFRNSMRAITDDVRKTNQVSFAKLTAADQDAYLKALEGGGKDLGGVPSNIFFQSLLEMTIEGFFSDPAYGGNKDMAAWKQIGFPGAYANYYDLVDKHGIEFRRPPMSLAQDASGTIHIHVGPPAQSAAKGR